MKRIKSHTKGMDFKYQLQYVIKKFESRNASYSLSDIQE